MIDQIEAGIQTRLNHLAGSNSFKVKCETYGGELDDNLLADAAQKAPAFWIAFAGAKKTRGLGRGGDEWEANFVVISAAKSMHQDQSRLGGREGKILGAYELILFAIASLEGYQPVDGCTALDPKQVTNLFNARIEREYLAIYSVTFSCRFILERVPDATLDDLESIFHSSKPHVGGPASKETPTMDSEIDQQETE
jgi:phage gp37-like protein